VQLLQRRALDRAWRRGWQLAQNSNELAVAEQF
jgi:hypothetical protein